METTKQAVDDFVAQKSLAVVGVSRSGKKFGNYAFKALKNKGYKLFPVHPEAGEIQGKKAYKDFASLPEPVGGVLVVVPPSRSEQVVRDAHEAGIKQVWLQQGAESEAAITYGEANGLSVCHHHCIMMYTQQGGMHGFHGWIWDLLGKAPK